MMDNNYAETVQFLCEDVLNFHDELKRSGAKMKKDGETKVGAIAGAVGAIYAGYGGVEAYPTIDDKAAALWHGIANAHGFSDGNKRTATHSMLCFLAINGIELAYTQKELADMAVLVGTSNDAISREEISQWITARAYMNDPSALEDGLLIDIVSNS